ncbi:MAG TPA: nucleotidyltransferase domain-containing protein [Acidobacteriota bacterium]|nr:nucleotidyltransferase domain-containing protein [Acidobacteriota bacterium]
MVEERWLSVDDVAIHLGIRRGTVYKWVERLGLPARKVGRLLRFKRSEIDAWVEKRSAGAGKPQQGQRLLDQLRAAVPEMKERFGVKKIGVFGSAARGEAGPASDVDVLVEFDDPAFDRYMELKFYLEDLFGRPCDLVLDESLKEGLRGSVHAEVLYA